MGRGGIAGNDTPAAPVLRARRLRKTFGPVRALDGADITLWPGEVHCLVGENGSGKSTLIRLLSGYHAPGAGAELEVAGGRVPLPMMPGQARDLGLVFIHQDLGLIPSLSVLDNLLLEQIATARWKRVAWGSERRRARALFESHGLGLDLAAPVRRLRPLERAQLAIVRALAADCRVLVLDETTSFLPDDKRRALFAQLRAVASRGAAVLLTTHDLAEARANGDRVTVLRDGRGIGTLRPDEVDDRALFALVTGRGPGRGRRAAATRLAPSQANGVEGVSGGATRNVAFDLPDGEVVGLAGLPGSGHDELPYVLYGARPGTGRLLLEGRAHDLAAMTPERARRAGVGLVPGDRLVEGGVPTLSVSDNVLLPTLRGRVRSRRRMWADAHALLAAHGVEPADPDLRFGALSGGNQQKALLAKWLHTRPTLLLLDEPLRGVDAAAREQLTAMVRASAVGDGTRVLCASADHGHLTQLCDRVVVLARGRVAGVLAGPDVTRDRIAELCLG